MQLDTDYSGTLDREEFRRFLESLNIHVTAECYNATFDLLDIDGSNSVEYR